MQNQNKTIKDIDDRIKNRDEIEEMIADMMNSTEDGLPEKKKLSDHKKAV